jgi:hypothetical protein
VIEHYEQGRVADVPLKEAEEAVLDLLDED